MTDPTIKRELDLIVELKTANMYFKKLIPFANRLQQIMYAHVGSDKTLTNEELNDIAKISGALKASEVYISSIEKLVQ